MASDGIMTMEKGITSHFYPGEWPSGKVTDFELVGPPNSSENDKKMLLSPPQRFVNGVTWTCAPEWLTFEEACYLSGYDRGTMLQVLDVDGVDLDNAGRIEKRSLWEWIEVSVEYAHWDD